jgi:hypothetical protein
MVLNVKAEHKAEPGQAVSIKFSTAPHDGQAAVEQRLQNLIDLAISIGRRDGLIGSIENNQIQGSEGG